MKLKLVTTPLIGSALFIASINLHAEGVIEALSGTNINDSEVLKNAGVEVGGWAAAGITYATHDSKSNRNDPIGFNDRINELMLNQFNLYLERAVASDGNEWDIGGRVDFMFGTDADNTQATGLDNKIMDLSYYDVAFPQAYVEIYAPFGNGITAKLGHFYTTIGYEVVPAPDNFFYSHAYTMLYAEPFTHTGALFSYPINDNFEVYGGAVLGWDNFKENGGDWSFLGGVNWSSDDEKTSLAVSLITGENGDDSVSANTTMYSVVFSHDFTESLHYVFQHDFGTAKDGLAPGRDTDWYGINQYLMYDINDEFSAGIRAEWFDDTDGTRTGFDANYYAVSAGINYSPASWIKFRPEVRYDYADSNTGVFNAGSEDDQFAVAMDMIVTF